MAGKMTLNPDFKEFIESLNANDVRYLVVGGYKVKPVAPVPICPAKV